MLQWFWEQPAQTLDPKLNSPRWYWTHKVRDPDLGVCVKIRVCQLITSKTQILLSNWKAFKANLGLTENMFLSSVQACAKLLQVEYFVCFVIWATFNHSQGLFILKHSGIIPRRLGGLFGMPRNWIQIGYIQGKHPIRCTVTLAPISTRSNTSSNLWAPLGVMQGKKKGGNISKLWLLQENKNPSFCEIFGTILPLGGSFHIYFKEKMFYF